MTRNEYLEQVAIIAAELRLAVNAGEQMDELAPGDGETAEKYIGTVIRSLMRLCGSLGKKVSMSGTHGRLTDLGDDLPKNDVGLSRLPRIRCRQPSE